jgi:hypothetical protein
MNEWYFEDDSESSPFRLIFCLPNQRSHGVLKWRENYLQGYMKL